MKVIDLIKAICKCHQEEDLNIVVEDCKDFFQSEEYFEILLSSLLNRSYLELRDDKLFLDEDYENEISVERLNTDIRDGYWFCAFFCCVGYYMFTWFSTLEEALNSYLSLTQEDYRKQI